MHAQTLIFFGKSGAGKGTQAEKIKELLKNNNSDKEVVHFETGKTLRSFNTSSDTFAAQRNDSIMQEGGLLPAFMPAYQWSKVFIETLTNPSSQHLIVDGSPRSLDESRLIDGALKFFQREKPICISIDISDESAVERLLKRGRSDDDEKEIRNRLSWYHKNVTPALEYFEQDPSYTVFHIDGEQTIEEIHQDLQQKLGL